MKLFFDTLKKTLFLTLLPAVISAGNSAPIPSAMLKSARSDLVQIHGQNSNSPSSDPIDESINIKKSVQQEELQEEESPLPPPALFEVGAHSKKDPSDISSLAKSGLIIFNAIMFTTGIVLVKGTSGKKVD